MSTDAPTGTTESWPYWTEPSTLEVDGRSVAYRRGGQGHTLLFLHGAQLTRAWLPFHEALATGADVVAPEHPGFGDTPRPDHYRSFDDLVLHYDSVVEALGLDGADLVGQGHGAWLAAKLAITYPRRFRSLTLVTPFGLRLPDTDTVDIYRLTPEEELAALLNERVDELSPIFAREEFPVGQAHQFAERTMLAYLAWNPRYDWRLDELLARVSVPTLVIGADEDRYGANAQADRYAELIAGARFERIPGDDGRPSSHLVHVEAPERTARAIHSHINATA